MTYSSDRQVEVVPKDHASRKWTETINLLRKAKKQLILADVECESAQIEAHEAKTMLEDSLSLLKSIDEGD